MEQGRCGGPSTYQFLAQVLEKPGLVNQRKAQGVLRLAEKYGSDRLEAACARSIAFENYSYRSLKGILVQGLDKRFVQEEPRVSLPKQGSYLRQRHELQALCRRVGL